MARRRTAYPDRLSDPLARVESYVNRRVGLPDPARQARRIREQERAPRLDPGAAVQRLEALPLDAEMLEEARLYLVRGGTGDADRIYARLKNSDDAIVLAEIPILSSGLSIGSTVRFDGTRWIRGPQLLIATAAWNPGNIADGGVVSTTIAVAGVSFGDPVHVGFSSITNQNWLLSGSVVGVDTVGVAAMNKTGGTVDLASGTLRVTVEHWT